MARARRGRPAPATIERIKTTKLINKLLRFIFAVGPDHKDMMTPGQVTAALGLLKKTLPDLAAAKVESILVWSANSQAN